MLGQELFTWNGKPIEDIKQFCIDNNCKMVKYKNVKREINPYNGTSTKSETIGKMPALFFDCMRMDKHSGYYIELSRYSVKGGKK